MNNPVEPAAQSEPSGQDDSSPPAPRWQPIPAIDRRVLGVLGEKAKTTPDAYPMTLNAIKTGANQKNNRFPLMEVEVDDVSDALDRLRGLGAVAEIRGDGRVAKYRHLLYEWLGVSKVEMAVMVELLLRGAQTEGELRGRAARMEPIGDLAALRPVLASLTSKGLIISLSPEGRGHALTHALYEERELEKVRREFQPARPADEPASEPPIPRPAAASHAAVAASAPPHVAAGGAAPAARPATPSVNEAALASVVAAIESLRGDVAQLQSEMARARKDLDDLWSQFR